MTSAAAINATMPGTGIRQWCLWLCALAAAASLTALASFGIYPPGDIVLTRTVQAIRLPGLDLLSEFIYRLGVSPTFQLTAVAIAAVMALRNHRVMALFMVLAAVAQLTTALLKELVERPRPSPFLVDVAGQAGGGFSFPSGHVLGAVLLWGFLYFACERIIASPRTRRWLQWSSLAIIALMGLQRVYAGAHWPSDVLAAYLWGGVILFALVKLYEFCGCSQVRSWMSRLQPRCN